MHVKSIDRVVQ